MEAGIQKFKTSWRQIQHWLAIALLALAPFSFAPSVALPVLAFPSFRVGFYQLLLVTFVLLTFWLQRSVIWRQLSSNRWLQLGAGGVVLVIINSLLVTLDLSRTLLLSSSVGLLVGASFSMYIYVKQLGAEQQFMQRAGGWIVGVGVIVAAVGIVQFVVGSFDQSVVADGLCEGCRGGVFGFPRINGFAIEPQFFANALLPAIFISLVQLVQSKKYKDESEEIKRSASQPASQTPTTNYYLPSAKSYALALLLITAFALSFSRGANLALASGVIVLAIQLLRLGRAKQLLRISAVLAGGYLLAATMMIGTNYLQFRDENPRIVAETFETLVEHGSAGLIELSIRENTGRTSNVERQTSGAMGQSTNPKPLTPNPSSFAPPQQIEASGDERLTAAKTGLGFLDNRRRALLGVGLGNLGPYAASQDAGLPSNLTIYIQYALVVVEVGIIGLVLFVGVHGTAAWRVFKRAVADNLFELALGAVMVSFMVQYFFYGTYINTTYIWVYLGLALGLSARPSEKVLQSQPQ